MSVFLPGLTRIRSRPGSEYLVIISAALAAEYLPAVNVIYDNFEKKIYNKKAQRRKIICSAE